jgi:hypothetical protein
MSLGMQFDSEKLILLLPGGATSAVAKPGDTDNLYCRVLLGIAIMHCPTRL